MEGYVDDDLYYLEEVALEDDADDIPIETVLEDVSDDDVDDELDLRNALSQMRAGDSGTSTKPERQRAGSVSLDQTTTSAVGASSSEQSAKRPLVVDDYIRNFLVKLNMQKTLAAFQAEWYSMKQAGQLHEEDAAVPDLYARNEALDRQVRQLRQEVEDMRALASNYKGTWDKFKKERDFHRMHHRRVQQEKSGLLRDLKRLQSHYSTFEPALEAARKKYEAVAKEKILMQMERDKLRSRCEALEAQVKSWENHSLDGIHGESKQQAGSSLSPFANTSSNSTTPGTATSTGFIPPVTRQRSQASGPSFHGGTSRMSERLTLPPASGAAGAAGSTRKDPLDSPWPVTRAMPAASSVNYPPAHYERFAVRKTVKAHSMAVSSVALHPSKPVAATASDDRTWKMWAMPRGDLILSGEGHKDWIASVKFHPRGTLLGTASGDGTLKLWDFMETQACLSTFSDHRSAVWDLAFHDGGDFVASASMDHTAKLWDIHSQRCRQTFRGHLDSVNSVCFQPFSGSLCTAAADKTVSLWDPRAGVCSLTLYGHGNALNHVSFDASGTHLVSGDADGVVKLWDLRAPQQAKLSIETADRPRCAVNQAYVDPSLQQLIVASEAGVVRVYSAENGELLRDLDGHEGGGVQAIAIDPKGQFLLSAGADNTFRYYSV